MAITDQVVAHGPEGRGYIALVNVFIDGVLTRVKTLKFIDAADYTANISSRLTQIHQNVQDDIDNPPKPPQLSRQTVEMVLENLAVISNGQCFEDLY